MVKCRNLNNRFEYTHSVQDAMSAQAEKCDLRKVVLWRLRNIVR